MKTKAISYAYPTSPHAKRFGFPNGCYVVETIEAIKVPEAVAAFATFDEAKRHADPIDLPWNRYTLVK